MNAELLIRQLNALRENATTLSLTDFSNFYGIDFEGDKIFAFRKTGTRDIKSIDYSNLAIDKFYNIAIDSPNWLYTTQTLEDDNRLSNLYKFPIEKEGITRTPTLNPDKVCDTLIRLEENVNLSRDNSEKQGFINGFLFTLKLLQAVTVKKILAKLEEAIPLLTDEELERLLKKAEDLAAQHSNEEL